MQLISATWLPLERILAKQYLEVVWKVSLLFLPSVALSGFCSVRIKLFAILSLLVVLLGSAHEVRAADYAANTSGAEMFRARRPYSPGPGYDYAGPFVSTGQAACDAAYAKWYTNTSYTGQKFNGAYRCVSVPGSYNGPEVERSKAVCLYGGTLSGTMCVGGDPPAGVPTGPDCTDKNPMIRRFNYGVGPYTTPDHFGECKVTPVELLVCRKENGSIYCMWMIKRTGEPYTGTDVPGTGAGGEDKPDVPTLPATTSPPIVPKPQPGTSPNSVPCPKGSVQAGVNSDGVPICVGTGTKPSAPPVEPEKTTSPPVTTNNPDGSSVTVITTTQKNSDGSTTTTTRTTTRGVDGSETVKTDVVVGKTPTGSDGSTDTPDRDKYDLCKQNPTLAVCRNSSVSGSCGEITCQGDAIQCATLRAAAAMQCSQKADEESLKASPQTALGNAVLSGADPMQADISTTLKGTEVDLSKPALDSSGFLAGGSCLPNKTFTVAGRVVTVEFTTLCDNIQPLRAVIMACAFIAAYMLVARSVVQS